MRTFVVLTTINSPTPSVRALDNGLALMGWNGIAVGDVKSPSQYSTEKIEFISYAQQQRDDFRYSSLCPTNHYARKNVGYLHAIERGAECIIDIDDDNQPLESFWTHRQAEQPFQSVALRRWTNIYSYYADALIWPRGFPLDEIKSSQPPTEGTETFYCPLQQGLADGDPDVDAVYRLVIGGRTTFQNRAPIRLSPGAWCPINSQNTTWFQEIFPLLYIPATCSFRACDIWRGFIAQAVLWSKGIGIGFHGADVLQDRNEHDFLNDFRQEIDVYLRPKEIAAILEGLQFSTHLADCADDLSRAYQALVAEGFFAEGELALLTVWLEDLAR